MWRRLGLQGQFLAAAAAVLLTFSTVEEYLQSRWVEQMFRKNSAEVAAVYVSGIIAPHIHAPVDTIEVGSWEHAHLETVLRRAGLKNQIERLKIWRPDGTIIYSTVGELVGRRFDTESLGRAARGEIVVASSDPRLEEDALGAESRKPMIEIWVPIRGADGKVIAVGELHKDRDRFNAKAHDLIEAMWLFRSVFLVLGGLTLFVLVRRAHRTIVRQRRQLQFHYHGVRRLADQNEALRRAAEEARRKAAKSNEVLLSRVGAEIHDGPIQLLSIALLGLGAKSGTADSGGGDPTRRDHVTSLMSDAISELRNLSTGLILPEIEDLPGEDAIHLAIARHEALTGTTVEAHVAELPKAISQALKSCLYRVVQECLTNAARHADGKDQRVDVTHDGRTIVLAISDGGPGYRETRDAQEGRPRLGLLGARNRVEAFGGEFRIEPRPTGGTLVTARLPVDEEPSGVSSDIGPASRSPGLARSDQAAA